MAIEDGTTLEAMLYEGLRSILSKCAADADIATFERVLKWVARFEVEGMEPNEKAGSSSGVNVNVGVVAPNGPSMPTELDDYYTQLEAIEQQHGGERLRLTVRDADVDDILS